MRAGVALLVICACMVGLLDATGVAVGAEDDFASENPFLSAGADADDTAAAENEMRAERFRLERESVAVSQLPSLMLMQTDGAATTTVTTGASATAAASTATTATTASTAVPPPPVAAATATVPVAVPAVALVEASNPSDKAPFMPGWTDEEETAPPAPAKAEVPNPPPAPVATPQPVAEAVTTESDEASASVPAVAVASSEVADVTESEAAELLAAVSRVVSGQVHTSRFAQKMKAKAATKHHQHSKKGAQRNGYGRPHAKHTRTHGHHHSTAHHARAAGHHHHHSQESESPRFQARTESDLVAEAKARAAALLGESMSHSDAAVAEREATVRAKRVEYAAHSKRMADHLHRFVSHRAESNSDAEADSEIETETESDSEAEGETETETESESESESESKSEAELDAEADAEADLDVATEAAEAEAAEAEAAAAKIAAEEAAAKAKSEAEAKAKAAASAAAAQTQSQANSNLLKSRFAQQRMRSRHHMRARGGAAPAGGYGPPTHFPADTHGSPPVMSSTVDLPLNRPPTPNYFYPPTAPPPPAAIQVPRLQSPSPNPAPFAPQYPNMDSLQSHQMNPYGRFPTMAPPMQREPPASLYPPYSSVPNFNQPQPRSGLNIELPEPAGGAPSLMEWTASIHRNRHPETISHEDESNARDRPVVPFAGFSAPLPQEQQ